MAFPAGMTLITVTGQIAGWPDESPCTVRFICPQWLTGPADDVLVAPFSVDAGVTSDGEFTADLPATDDPTWVPQGWAYIVLMTSGSHTIRGTLTLPYDGGPVELSDRIDLDYATVPGAAYVLLASRGVVNGVATLDGTGKVPAGQLPASSGGSPAWTEITGKPSTFPPSTHTHAVADVTGLQAALDGHATDAELAAIEGRVTALEDAPGGGGGTTLVVKRATITTGNVSPQATSPWAALTGGPTLSLPAAVGDYVEFQIVGGMWDPGPSFLDLAVVVAGAAVRYLSTGTATPAIEGAPSFYADPQTYEHYGPTFEFVVASGDLSGGNVTVGFWTQGSGGGTLFASTAYPLRWRALNYGPATVS